MFIRTLIALATAAGTADAFLGTSIAGINSPGRVLSGSRRLSMAVLEGQGAAPFGTNEDLKDTMDRIMQGNNFKKKINLLGSTGSIGTQTLDIVDYMPVSKQWHYFV